MKELTDLRLKIDGIDEQIVELLKKRFDVVSEVAAIKKEQGLAVYAPDREKALLHRLSMLAGTEYETEIRALYSSVLSLSKARQRALMQLPPREAARVQEKNLSMHTLEQVENKDLKITVAGMGGIGGSLFKAAQRAGYEVMGIDPNDSVDHSEAIPEDNASLGTYLKLSVFGASHASTIGMKLERFPRGFKVSMDELQQFLECRAPGRDAFSTSRHEADVPFFRSGFSGTSTTGENIEAVIVNSDCRPGDYGSERTVPRPGHADFSQWIQTGRIPTGGGSHSGRMTAPLCVAGGICLQWLKKRGISISGKLLSAGGNCDNPEAAILAARQDGDSVGGIIEVQIHGMKPGLGGALFRGVETELASAMFAIPGVKGLEIGGGFSLASKRGSQANDSFDIENGKIITRSNNHGGLLGGITTGMPVVFRLAMKPTPSIFIEQDSVDLKTKTPASCSIKGRHDPCIARRAVPVAEAMAAFVFADLLLADEAAHPRICLTLVEDTIEKNLAALKASLPFVDMCELRADCLAPDQRDRASSFPKKADIPVILTLRRTQDGGKWAGTEDEREQILKTLLEKADKPFEYVDLEDDFRRPELEMLAHACETRIIRSLHDFSGPVEHIVARASAMRGCSDEIPKIAYAVNHCSDMERLFRETADFTGFPYIICGMGNIGQASRILAVKTHSMLTFVSPQSSLENMKAIGHLTPENLVRTYGFRSISCKTELYAVTGWPLGHSLSPELNNAAFFDEAQNTVMVPLPAETAAEALKCAETLGVRGMAVTVPHKKDMAELMDTLSPEAAAICAVNTVIRTVAGWHGANTDIAGFRTALVTFLNCSDLRGRKVAIIGAGGAANAVAYVISQLGGTACVFNRTLDKAEKLAALYGFKAAALDPENSTLLAEFSEIMVQTTSVGLSSNQGSESDPIPFYEFHGNEAVYDLIYSPAETPMLGRARKAGCRTENGLSMLVEQAREQRRLYKENA